MILEFPTWKLEDALEFIRPLQTKAWECNLHLALAGSVLNHGSSINDLDLICMSQHNDKTFDWYKFHQFLETLGELELMTGEKYQMKGRLLYKLYLPDKRAVDIFRYDI